VLPAKKKALLKNQHHKHGQATATVQQYKSELNKLVGNTIGNSFLLPIVRYQDCGNKTFIRPLMLSFGHQAFTVFRNFLNFEKYSTYTWFRIVCGSMQTCSAKC